MKDFASAPDDRRRDENGAYETKRLKKEVGEIGARSPQPVAGEACRRVIERRIARMIGNERDRKRRGARDPSETTQLDQPLTQKQLGAAGGRASAGRS